MVMGCMGWNEVGILAGVEEWMDSEQYVSILRTICFPALKILKFLRRALFFNRIITLRTPSKGLKTGSNLKELGPLAGTHSC